MNGAYPQPPHGQAFNTPPHAQVGPDTIEWGSGYIAQLVLELVGFGVIVAALIGTEEQFAPLGLFLIFIGRFARRWVKVDPQTRTVKIARGYRWLSFGRSYGFDELTLEVKHQVTTTIYKRAGREVSRARNTKYVGLLVNGTSDHFETFDAEAAYASMYLLQAAIGRPLDLAMLKNYWEYRVRTALTLTASGAAAFALAVGICVYAAFQGSHSIERINNHFVTILTLFVPLGAALLYRAAMVGRWPRCVPALFAVKAPVGPKLAGALAVCMFAAVAGMKVYLAGQQEVVAARRERIGQELRAIDEAQRFHGSVRGLHAAPTFATPPALTEALNQEIIRQRLEGVGFEVTPRPPAGPTGFRLSAMAVRSDGQSRGELSYLSLGDDSLKVVESRALVVAVRGGTPATRETLATRLSTALGGYGVILTPSRLRDAVEAASMQVVSINQYGSSVVRARGAREPLEFMIVELQAPSRPSATLRGAGYLLVVETAYGRSNDTLPWANCVLGVAAGATPQ